MEDGVEEEDWARCMAAAYFCTKASARDWQDMVVVVGWGCAELF